MAKVIRDTQVYYKGMSQLLKAGVEYPDDAEIVVKNKDFFKFEDKPKKSTRKTKTKVKEEPKEELLVEEPVVALEVSKEESKEEEKPTRRKRK